MDSEYIYICISIARSYEKSPLQRKGDVWKPLIVSLLIRVGIDVNLEILDFSCLYGLCNGISEGFEFRIVGLMQGGFDI